MDGDRIEIYSTGLGPLEPSPATGTFDTVRTPTVTLNGVDAPVAFSSMASGVPGLCQINAPVPDNAPHGVVKPRIALDGAASNEANVTLHLRLSVPGWAQAPGSSRSNQTWQIAHIQKFL
jgi:uncharacterized protein (TIGR03437 family)